VTITCKVSPLPIGFAGGRYIYEPEPPNPHPVHRFPAMVREMNKMNTAWSAGNKALFEYQLARKRGDMAAAEVHGAEYDRQADNHLAARWRAEQLRNLIRSLQNEIYLRSMSGGAS